MFIIRCFSFNEKNAPYHCQWMHTFPAHASRIRRFATVLTHSLVYPPPSRALCPIHVFLHVLGARPFTACFPVGFFTTRPFPHHYSFCWWLLPGRCVLHLLQHAGSQGKGSKLPPRGVDASLSCQPSRRLRGAVQARPAVTLERKNFAT